MKRKKGFTLIELLAVIVILAIIATIATPIVLSIIEDTKESTTLRNAEYYLDAVEQSIARKSLNTGNAYQPLECEIQEDGNLLCDEEVEVIVEVKGKKPSGGTITFEKGKVNDITLNLDNKKVTKNEKGEFIIEKDTSPGDSTPNETPTEPSVPENVVISGVWVFKAAPTFDLGERVSVSFTSNGQSFSSMYFVSGDGEIYYDSKMVGEFGDFIPNEWRTVDFGTTGQTVSSEFYYWLIANAIQQESGAVNLITFTISTLTYQAEEGMTWEEWVNSNYNTDEFGFKGAWAKTVNKGRGYVYNTTTNAFASKEDGDFTPYETNIIANGIYATKEVPHNGGSND